MSRSKAVCWLKLIWIICNLNVNYMMAIENGQIYYITEVGTGFAYWFICIWIGFGFWKKKKKLINNKHHRIIVDRAAIVKNMYFCRDSYLHFSDIRKIFLELRNIKIISNIISGKLNLVGFYFVGWIPNEYAKIPLKFARDKWTWNFNKQRKAPWSN